MRYVGIDMHKRFLVACVQDDAGQTLALKQMACRDMRDIARFSDAHRPFHAVIEASSSYRWLYDLLSPLGEVIRCASAATPGHCSRPGEDRQA